jgi:cephalosporin hydroxylase
MIVISEEHDFVEIQSASGKQRFPLNSPEAFAAVSKAWLRCGWDTKYVYTFTWMGRPVIQLPEDLLRIQEVVYAIRPDILIETGVAHGGSLVFYASLFKAMNRGRVVGIDIEIRPHNRKAIETHPLASYITLIEGSSIAPEVFDQAKSYVKPGETVMVVLDSCHTKKHVQDELEIYSSLVTPESYIVATDGIMKNLVGAPRSKPDWGTNNPHAAVQEFLKGHPEFILEQPRWFFNESNGLFQNVTYWPGAWLKRL